MTDVYKIYFQQLRKDVLKFKKNRCGIPCKLEKAHICNTDHLSTYVYCMKPCVQLCTVTLQIVAVKRFCDIHEILVKVILVLYVLCKFVTLAQYFELNVCFSY